MALHMPSRRSRLATATAFGLAAAIVAFGGTVPANAAVGDTAEAEGRLLTLSGEPNLSAIAQLSGAYTGFRPGDAVDPQRESGVIDATVLSGLLQAQIAADIQLGDILTLDQAVAGGAANQYASSGSVGATGAAGAVTDMGAINLNAGSGDVIQLDLAPLLGELGATGTVSDLSLGLGALSATATDPGAGQVTSGYNIASADANITSPLVGALGTSVNNGVGSLAPSLNTTLQLQPQLATSLDNLLTDLLGPLLGRALSVQTPTGTIALSVNTQAAVNAVLAEPLTSGAVTINVAQGTISVDLGQILDDQPANTPIVLADTIALAVDDILTNLLPAAVLEEVLDSTRVVVNVNAVVNILGGILPSSVAIRIDTTLADLLDPAAVLPIDVSGTRILGLPVGANILQPLTDLVVSGVLPSLRTSLGEVLQLEDVTAITTPLIGSLSPVLDVVGEIVQLTVNRQTTTTAPGGPNGFQDPEGTSTAGIFTVTALRVSLLPLVNGPVIDLASASVRAEAVVAPATPVDITSPTPDQNFAFAGDATTADVPVSGTADESAPVTVSIAGQPTQTSPVAAGGGFSVEFPGLVAGTYTATASQTVGGVTTTDTVTFTVGPVAPDVAPVTILEPDEDEVIPGGTQDVIVSGTAEPGATVTVSIPGETDQVVTADDVTGAFEATFPALPADTYTATATQVVGGVESSDTVTFTVSAAVVVAPVAILEPDEDEVIAGGTQ
ncbi:choice-of-anchor G family protein, partial [Clavibacter sp. MX14-G9D]|uniref:choice-of-anchor G family protein n=1 Tax=Clavibacter sp. MX14-G9D TaxID=3064656 RepID=UPI00293F2B85